MTRSRQRRDVPRRRVVFVGVEGKSDRAFVRFLGLLCDRAGLHVHLDVRPSNGGDSLEVVRETARRLRRHPYRREIATRLVLLDSDRMRADRTAGRDALAEAEKRGLEAMLFNPNLEGLLVRLHQGVRGPQGTGAWCGEPAPEALVAILQVVADRRSATAAILPRRPQADSETRRGAAQAAGCPGTHSAGLTLAHYSSAVVWDIVLSFAESWVSHWSNPPDHWLRTVTPAWLRVRYFIRAATPTSPAPVLNLLDNVLDDLRELFGHSRRQSRHLPDRSHQRH